MMNEEYEDDEYEDDEYEDDEDEYEDDEDEEDEKNKIEEKNDAQESFNEDEQDVQVEHKILDEKPISVMEEPELQEPQIETYNEIENMSNKEFIAYIQELFYEHNSNTDDKDDLWKRAKSQITSALLLDISKQHIKNMIISDFDYKQREAIKFLYALGEINIVKKMQPKHTFQDIASIYEASKVQQEIVKRLDAPLNSLNKMMETYKEDFDTSKKALEEKINNINKELDDTKAKLEMREKELEAIKEKKKQEEKELERQKEIELIAERKAREMFNKELAEKKREDSYAMEIEKLKAMIQAASEQPARKKKGFFKKKGKAINNDVSMEPIAYISDEPLPKNFVLRDYLISKSIRLASSQLEVISLAVKCNVTDEFAKKMIDMATNGSDSIALKSVLEVELAKRNEATKINMDDIAECDIYE